MHGKKFRLLIKEVLKQGRKIFENKDGERNLTYTKRKQNGGCNANIRQESVQDKSQ